MYRFLFRPKWLLFHVLVVAAIALMVALGFWQLRRHDERKDFNALLVERSEQAPLPLDELVDDIADGSTTPSASEWRRVTASGSYLSDQLVQFNRSQGGRSGENVLTAIVLDDGTTAIVNRGFVPLGVETPPAPGGRVEIVGYVRESQVRGRGGVTDELDGERLTEVRRIDIPLIAPQLPGEVAPFYVQLVDAEPAISPTDPEPVVLPELDNGPHLSYAIQWFIFASCVAIGWVLAVRRSWRSRRSGDTQAADAAELAEFDDVTAAHR